MRPRRLRRPGAPCAGVPPSERWKGQKQVSYLGSDKRRHGFAMTSVSRWCARTTGSEAVRLLPFCQHARLLPTCTRQRYCSSLLIACAFRVAPQPRPGTCVITTSLRNTCATGITRDRAGAGPHLGLHLDARKVVRGETPGRCGSPRRPPRSLASPDDKGSTPGRGRRCCFTSSAVRLFYCTGTGRSNCGLKNRLPRAAKMIGVKPITAA